MKEPDYLKRTKRHLWCTIILVASLSVVATIVLVHITAALRKYLES